MESKTRKTRRSRRNERQRRARSVLCAFFAVTLALGMCPTFAFAGDKQLPEPSGLDAPAAGDPSGDDPTSGDPAGGDPAGGDPAGGDPAGGDPAGGDPAGGDPAGGDPAGGDPAGGDPAGGDPAGGDPVGGDPAGDNPAGGDPAGDNPAGGDPAGDKPAADNPAGDKPAADDPAADKKAEDNPADEKTATDDKKDEQKDAGKVDPKTALLDGAQKANDAAKNANPLRGDDPQERPLISDLGVDGATCTEGSPVSEGGATYYAKGSLGFTITFSNVSAGTTLSVRSDKLSFSGPQYSEDGKTATYTATVSATLENVTVTAHYTNGSTGGMKTFWFSAVINDDSEAPDVSIKAVTNTTYTNPDRINFGSGDPAKMKVTVTEPNLDTTKTKVKLNGDETSVTWDVDGNVNTCLVDLVTTDEYETTTQTVSVKAWDKFGNASDDVSATNLIVDKKKPQNLTITPTAATIAPSDDDPKAYYQSAPASFAVSAEDAHVFAGSITYKVDNGAWNNCDSSATSVDVDNGVVSSTISNPLRDPSSTSVADGTYVFAIQANDNSVNNKSDDGPLVYGNISDEESLTVVVDGTGPALQESVEISPDGIVLPGGEMKGYKEDVKFSFKFKDPNFDKSKMIFSCSKDGASSDNFTVDWTEPTEGSDTEGSDTEGSDVWIATVTIAAATDGTKDGDYKLTLTGKDKLDNEMTGAGIVDGVYESATFRIDTQAPEISVTYDPVKETLVEGSKVFQLGNNVGRTATIAVTDASFDPDKIKIVAKVGDEALTPSDWVQDQSDPKVWRATVEFKKDGTCSLAVTGPDADNPKPMDALGNQANAYGPDVFEVDGRNPVATVEFSEAPVADNVYCASGETPIKLTVTVEEKNFKYNDTCFLEATLTKDGSPVTSFKLEDTGADEKWVATKEFAVNGADDGHYSLSVSKKDIAGNLLTGDGVSDAGVYSYDFIVDHKAPEINVKWDSSPTTTVGGIDYYNGRVTATITVKSLALNKSACILDAIGGAVTKQLTYEGQDADGKEIWEAKAAWANADFDDNPYDLNITAEGLNTKQSTYSYDETEGHSANFYVDTTTPKLEVSVDRSPSNSENNIDYFYQSPVKVTYTAVDNFFDKKSEITEAGGVLTQPWTQKAGSDTWTAVVTYDKETGYNKTHLPKATVNDLTGSHKVTYTYGKDQTKDSAGKNLEGTKGFVVDTVTPNIRFSLNKARDNESGGIDYFSSAVKATITVSDANFNPEKSKVTAKGATVSDDWTDNKNGSWTATINFTEDNPYGKSYKPEVTVNDMTGKHALSYVYGEVKGEVSPGKGGIKTTRAAGEALDDGEYGPELVVDTVKPSIVATINQPKQDTYKNVDYYGTANSKNKLTYTLVVTDNHFDTSTVIEPNGGKASAWEDNGDGTWTATVVYGESAGTTPYRPTVTLNDMTTVHAVNYGYGKQAASTPEEGGGMTTKDSTGASVSGTRGFILDLHAPTVEEAIATAAYAGAYENSKKEGSRPFLFYANDAAAKFTVADVSGIREVSVTEPFTISGGGTTNLGTSATRTVAFLPGRNGNELTDQIFVTLADYSNNSRSWSIAPDGTVKEVNVKQGASQKAKNALYNQLDALTHPRIIILDKIDPALSWTTSVRAGEFYSEPQRITLNVIEENVDYLQQYDPNQVVLTITKYEGNAGRAQSTPTVAVSQLSGSGDSWSYEREFAEDGHYSLEAELIDPALRRGTASFEEFTIDRTAPEIQSITFDNNNVHNGKYYDAGRTATITVIEHNWDASREGSFIQTNGSVGGWTHNGDTHTCTVSFANDGDYNLSVTITDRAGNTSATQTEPEFTVDLQDPKITFKVEQYTGPGGDEGIVGSYNHDFVPVVTFNDEKNLNPSSCTYTLTGSRNGNSGSGVGSGDSTTATANVTEIDANKTAAFDDIYTLTATAVDMADRRYEASVRFSVNRFGSTFEVVSPTEKQLTKGVYLSEPVDVVVREINVDSVTHTNGDVSVTHDMTTTQLKESSTPLTTQAQSVGGTKAAGANSANGAKAASSSAGLYSVDGGTVAGGWSEYTYTIPADNFVSRNEQGEDTGSDGEYHVVVTSKDAAGNINNSARYFNRTENKQASAEVDFVLDTRAPVVTMENIANGGVYENPDYAVVFTVADTIGVEDVKATLDGENREVTEQEDGTWSMTVPAKDFTARTLEIAATDLAGNSNPVTISDFHVTTNFIELHWPILLVVAGVAVVAIALVVWRRKVARARG